MNEQIQLGKIYIRKGNQMRKGYLDLIVPTSIIIRDGHKHITAIDIQLGEESVSLPYKYVLDSFNLKGC